MSHLFYLCHLYTSCAWIEWQQVRSNMAKQSTHAYILKPRRFNDIHDNESDTVQSNGGIFPYK